MSDKLTKEQRHKNMAAIRAKDTKPEIIVRKYLWSHGFRYRLNHPRLPGKPDIVLRKYRTCIFVNGCFWHGHDTRLTSLDMELESSECCRIPHTNREFWVEKIIRNKRRDVEVQRKLAAMGWHSITIWECELKAGRTQQPGEKSQREKTLEALTYTLNKIFLQDRQIRKYELTEKEETPVMAADNSEIGYGKP